MRAAYDSAAKQGRACAKLVRSIMRILRKGEKVKQERTYKPADFFHSMKLGRMLMHMQA